MQANDFWCRAFLAAMKKHGGDLERCQEIADAALWRAQRRGMVTVADLEPLRHAAVRWVAAARANNTDDFDAAEAALVKAAEALAGDPAVQPRQEPELERVEFKAERDHEFWLIELRLRGVGFVFRVVPGDERCSMTAGPTIRIKWAETMPPKPAEVWIERGAGSR